MGAYIDLHCHWVSGIDDGARTPAEGLNILRGLVSLGFSQVLATPHMRPGLFDNSREQIEAAYEAMLPQIEREPEFLGRLQVDLSCEHYFDPEVYQRILQGLALPYPGGRAVLLEFYDQALPPSVDHSLARLKRAGIIPVIAHPERYRAFWESPERLERLLDTGAVALLDAAALVGKYGTEPMRCAQSLLEEGMYVAACSDAHREADVELVNNAMSWIVDHYDDEEVVRLFKTGPAAILMGTAIS
jgi:protein-tyrosine phosphatase